MPPRVRGSGRSSLCARWPKPSRRRSDWQGAAPAIADRASRHAARMTAEDPLASATAKIGWAKRLLGALHDDISEFMSTKPFASTVDYNAETGWHDVTMHAGKPLPPDWPLMAGDLIQNIRNALDH